MPLDPVESSRDLLSPDNDPPFINDYPNLDLVNEGLDVAEDERREAADEKFMEEELDDDEIEETLNERFDDDDGPVDGRPSAPELSAIHQQGVATEADADFVDSDDEAINDDDLEDEDEEA